MIYQCPRCHAFNDVPIDYNMMRDVSLQCGHCAHITHYHNDRKTSDDSNAAHLIQCINCARMLTLHAQDHLLSATCSFACPFCGTDIEITPPQDTDSSAVLFFQLFVICACAIGALFLLTTPEGAAFITMLGTYSDKPIYYITTLRVAFFDMIAFLKGLFL